MEKPVTINTLKRFNEVITYWNDTFSYPTTPKDNGRDYPEGVSFRRILMLNWDRQVHYEFRCYNRTNEIGITFHSEPKATSTYNWQAVKKVVQSFRGLKIKDKEVYCTPNDNAMRSRLEIKLPLSSDIKDICERMAELINVTKQPITKALIPQNITVRPCTSVQGRL